jgi:ribonuclease R
LARRISGGKGGHASEGFRPSREELLAFVRDNPDQAGKRELARAFNL